MPRLLENYPSTQAFSKSLKIPPSNIYRNLINFPNAWVSGKFLKCLGVWEISQMPEYLGNFSKAWVSGKFPKNPGILEISKILKNTPLKYL